MCVFDLFGIGLQDSQVEMKRKASNISDVPGTHVWLACRGPGLKHSLHVSEASMVQPSKRLRTKTFLNRIYMRHA